MSQRELGQLEVERLDEVIVVKVLGEHDLSSASSLRQTLCSLAEEGCAIVADLSDTEFIDLAVVRALMAADDALDRRGHRLTVQIDSQAPTRRLFQVAGLDDLFVYAADRHTAIELARKASEGRGQPP